VGQKLACAQVEDAVAHVEQHGVGVEFGEAGPQEPFGVGNHGQESAPGL